MTAPLLDLRGVGCVLGGQAVVSDVSLQVQRGERLALIGPNGAGKSTLFQLISGLLRPNAGSIWLAGRRIDRLTPQRIARLGLARSFQSPQVFGTLSASDNLRCSLILRDVGGLMRNVAKDCALQEHTGQWLDTLGLNAVANLPASALDYASLRALELGLALAGDAPLLLLDEPTAGMNREQAGHMLALIEATCADRTLLVIEHDLDAVFRLAKRVVVLHQGRMLADGPPAAVRADPRVQQVYLGALPETGA